MSAHMTNFASRLGVACLLVAAAGCDTPGRHYERPDFEYRTVVDDANWSVAYTPLETRDDHIVLKSLWVERRHSDVSIESIEVQFTDQDGQVAYRDWMRPVSTSTFGQLGGIRVSTRDRVLTAVASVKSSKMEAPLQFKLLP